MGTERVFIILAAEADGTVAHCGLLLDEMMAAI